MDHEPLLLLVVVASREGGGRSWRLVGLDDGGTTDGMALSVVYRIIKIPKREKTHTTTHHKHRCETTLQQSHSKTVTIFSESAHSSKEQQKQQQGERTMAPNVPSWSCCSRTLSPLYRKDHIQDQSNKRFVGSVMSKNTAHSFTLYKSQVYSPGGL